MAGEVVLHGGRLSSGWWRELLKLEGDDSGFKTGWFSNVVKKVVGDGQNTLFWKDPWLEGGPLNVRFRRLFSLSMDKSGMVANLVIWRDGVCEWNWRWRRRLFQWEKDELGVLQSLIQSNGVRGEGGDRWFWEKEHFGSYSVRSAYKWLVQSDLNGNVVFYTNLWKGEAPLKVNFFVWKLAKNRIPSLQNLARRNVPLESQVCVGCQKEVESTSHLFFKCELFSALWAECLKWWGLVAPLHDECDVHFIQFCGLFYGSAELRQCWEGIWFVVVWVIWTSRNAMMFKKARVATSDMLEQVKMKSWLWITAKHPKFKYPLSNWFDNPCGCLGLVTRQWGCVLSFSSGTLRVRSGVRGVSIVLFH